MAICVLDGRDQNALEPCAEVSEATKGDWNRYYRVSFHLLLISDLNSHTDCILAVQGLDATSHFTWRKVSNI